MTETVRIRDLFVSDVTRDIPPVVYFHEQSPDKLGAEVSEYIITGGWPEHHPNHRRVPSGIHEEYVRLLTAIRKELERAGGPELPNVWISGFYGSGKSSFAKLLGLSLDGKELPGNVSLSEAWLRRDTSPRAADLRAAWEALRQKIDPIAVVFDIGAIARDNEHIHVAALRQVQQRLGYCADAHVASFELDLERDGKWAHFEEVARQALKRPWTELSREALAEEHFSHVMSVMEPERYTDPMSWYTSRGGTDAFGYSPDEVVKAIGDMLGFRKRGATLFLVVDEVSQYVIASKDRVDRLRAFATALGASLKGRVWLLALGQQKLDEEADEGFLVWAKDRFPPKLRVHLATTNIRDVVHKRLLQKKSDAESMVRALLERHRADLKLFAYKCEDITAEEFVDVYPMLPGQMDLILQITTALRTRSSRAQGDDQAIRGLLQLLGELFRNQKLADKPLGSLVTLDQIYEVQHTALDSDAQASMARVLAQCDGDSDGLLVRAAKAVALLELIQETIPTDAKLVAQCLFDRVDRGNQVPAVTEALEELRRRNLLGYSEKLGYKLQSSTGEEWERERRDFGVSREVISEIVQESLKYLLGLPERPRLEGRPFPWAGVFSDGRRAVDVTLSDPRDEASVRVDFRFLTQDERIESTWVQRSDETALRNRLVWLAGDIDQVDQFARELHRSRAMVRKYSPRRESLTAARKSLLVQEDARSEDLERTVRDAIEAAWMGGRLYFRGRPITPKDVGASFTTALHAAGTRVLPDLFPHFIATQVQPTELAQLLVVELAGPSPKFLPNDLGILELDSGRYVAACSGVVPRRVHEYIDQERGVSGTGLLAHFGAPPYGYTAPVVKACIAGLLRAGKVRIQPETGSEITAVRDAGVQDLFDKDRAFRRATIAPAGADDVGVQARARIARFFEEAFGERMDREDHAIADAVARLFTPLAARARGVQDRLRSIPNQEDALARLDQLQKALGQCVAGCRQTRPTVLLVKKHLDLLRDGVTQVKLLEADLTADALAALRRLQDALAFQVVQLRAAGVQATNVDAAAQRIEHQLASLRPWADLAALDGDLIEVVSAYQAERKRLLAWQEAMAEEARGRVKARQGFATLTADNSHHVLRSLADAVTDTAPEAVAPSLVDLKDLFQLHLKRAEDEANARLDQILSAGDRPLIRRVSLDLRNRELASAPDVDALLEELRTLLLEHIAAGARVRLQ